MRLTERAVNAVIKAAMRAICRVDAPTLDRVPRAGPAILVANHVNFLDVPVVYTHLQPRPLTAFSKVETWEHPLLGPLFTLWRVIPIRRGEADMQAIRAGLAALAAGQILAILPEGTRSGDGQLQRGHPGVVTMALRSGAPLVPLVAWGMEQYHADWRRLRRTPFHIAVGPAFTVAPGAEKLTGELRQAITDEIMQQLAALLPPTHRGVYAAPAPTPRYLRFTERVS